jgi:hypothetical protein
MNPIDLSRLLHPQQTFMPEYKNTRFFRFKMCDMCLKLMNMLPYYYQYSIDDQWPNLSSYLSKQIDAPPPHTTPE